ncbi:MAG: enoyl-CoA hydratase/isomerase family protein [Sciscionella sp.]
MALLLLDRPAVRNALDSALVRSLTEAIARYVELPCLRAIVLGSTVRAMFCAGADLSIDDAERREVSDALYGLYEQLVTAGVPVIAAVDGPTVGGGAQLALAADVRIGSADARFRFAGPGHGLAVGPWALPSTVGRRGLELVVSQRFVAAAEAAQWGLLDRIVPEPLVAALELASGIAQLDAAAVRRAKEHVVRGEHLLERMRAERSGNAAVFTGTVTRATR